MTATALRKDLYNTLDKLARTGKSLEINKRGQLFELVAKSKQNKLSRLRPHDAILGDPDELVDLHVYEWNEEKNL